MTKAEERALEAYPKRKDGRKKYFNGTDDDLRRLYAKAYRKAKKDLGWHSVDISLPEIDEEVIVLTDILVEGGLKVGFGRIAFGHIVDKERCIDYNGWNIPGVRYWMPCPKIPEE